MKVSALLPQPSASTYRVNLPIKQGLPHRSSVAAAWLPANTHLLLSSHQSPLLAIRPKPDVQCRSSAAAMNDPADIIPSPYDDEDEDDPGKVVPSTQHVAVIGAGPAGLLSAMYLARRKYNVDVYEREAPPQVVSSRRQHNYPIVMSSRALLAFRELKLETSYNGPQAPKHLGIWDVISGNLEPAQPNDENTHAVIVDRTGLVNALTSEAKRLYPDKIRLHYSSDLQALDIPGSRVIIRSTAPAAGAPLTMSADRMHRGTSLEVRCSRKGQREGSAAAPLIPSWDTAALEAAAAAAGMTVAEAAAAHEVSVRYDFLVGADGAESSLRRLMVEARNPKVRDFEVQLPTRDTESFKAFSGLPLGAATGAHMVPGFREHRPRQYLYRCSPPAAAAGTPRLEMWVSEPGVVSGIVVVPQGCSWEAGAMRQALQAAYGSKLPAQWIDSLVEQSCGEHSHAAQSCGRIVQCSQLHGPRMALLGDAGHAMTNESRQGLNCAVETVRVLNVVLKITGDNLARAGNVLTEVRAEDAHCMQMMEQMQRRQRPGVAHGDPMFAFAGWLAGMVWRAAALMVALLEKVAPASFRSSWVSESLRDCRKGYNEVLKVLTRFAAFPILAVIGITAYLMRGPLVAFIRTCV